MQSITQLFILVAIISALAIYAPKVFVSIITVIDTAKCSIGMESHCNQNYDAILNFSIN
jgi:hypothetical protein